jgi:hypothetical protein
MKIHVSVADCREHWKTATPEQPPIIMLERTPAYEKAPGQLTEPGRLGAWYVPTAGVWLEHGEWRPQDWTMTRRDKYVRVALHRYIVSSKDPRAVSAACVNIGLAAAAQIMSARLDITDIYILQGDVVPEADKILVYLGLAFCTKDTR